MNGDFAAFRTLWNAIPFTEEATQRNCDCLNWYIARCGKPLATIERTLALYKLQMEAKTQ